MPVLSSTQTPGPPSLVQRPALERALLTWLEAGVDQRVLYLHGMGGVGKSTAVQWVADRSGEIELEACRLPLALTRRPQPVVPAPVLERADVFLADVAGRLEDRGDGLDRCLLDLIPSLPERTRLVVASRSPIPSRWLAELRVPGPVSATEVSTLSETESRAFLTAARIDPRWHPSLLALTRGLPLGLTIGAARVATASPSAAMSDVIAGVSAELADFIVDGSPSPMQSVAVDLCGLLPEVTVDVVRAVVDAPAAAQLFAWLRRQSFVTPAEAGVAAHPAAQSILEHALRWRDPERHTELVTTLRRHVVARLVDAHGREARRLLRDLEHLEAGDSRLSTPAADPHTDRSPALPVHAWCEGTHVAASAMDALRHLHDPLSLRHNPLIEAAAVRERCAAHATVDERVAVLQSIVRDAVARLADLDHGQKLHRAVHHTHIQPATTQEAAAELLGIPYSTYRRHLRAGREAVVELVVASMARRPEDPANALT